MSRKKLRARGNSEIGKWDRDPNDCHRLPYLDGWIGTRGTFVTTKGTVCGLLNYNSGWYYLQAPEILQPNGEWTHSYARFLFRKGQFKSVSKPRSEYVSISSRK